MFSAFLFLHVADYGKEKKKKPKIWWLIRWTKKKILQVHRIGNYAVIFSDLRLSLLL
jgi:hypothetical protein